MQLFSPQGDIGPTLERGMRGLERDRHYLEPDMYGLERVVHFLKRSIHQVHGL